MLKTPLYTISRTDLQMAPIGYGCMTIGGNWSTEPWTSSEYEIGRKALAAALEQSITLFDHADIYTRGKSERLFGELLAEQPSLRQQIVLQFALLMSRLARRNAMILAMSTLLHRLKAASNA